MTRRFSNAWRENHSAALRAYWDSPAGQERRSQLAEEPRPSAPERWASFAANHPERAALIEATRAGIAAGEIAPQPCDLCGGEGRPLYDYAANTLAGWRCYPCRKVGR